VTAMVGILKIFFTLIVIAPLTVSQEIIDTIKTTHQPEVPRINFNLDDFDFYLDLQSLNKPIFLNNDPNTKWLWTSYAILNSSNQALSSDAKFKDMTTPLYQKYLEEPKLNPFRYALRMMQVGAVGYLAYKHIKKYGFLKK